MNYILSKNWYLIESLVLQSELRIHAHFFLLVRDNLPEFDLYVDETFNMLIYWLIFPFGTYQQRIIGSNVISTYLNL